MSTYNRDNNGVIHLKDQRTGEPIPRGSGIRETLTQFGMYDTYSTLTLAKLDSTVVSVFSSRVDNTPMEVIMYTGIGGAKAFHNAIMNDVQSKSGYFLALGTQVISGGEYLSYGKYFNQYKTIDGHIITVKTSKMFDQSLFAEMQRKNGQMIDGLPLFSYTMVFLDHSKTTDGERNVQLVCEEGREVLYGIYKGMSPVPAVWGNVHERQISTREDIATFEIIKSRGICLKNPTTSFWLDKSL
jgi:hypothetical protein